MPDITNTARNFDTCIPWAQLSQLPNMEKRAKMDPEDPGGSYLNLIMAGKAQTCENVENISLGSKVRVQLFYNQIHILKFSYKMVKKRKSSDGWISDLAGYMVKKKRF